MSEVFAVPCIAYAIYTLFNSSLTIFFAPYCVFKLVCAMMMRVVSPCVSENITACLCETTKAILQGSPEGLVYEEAPRSGGEDPIRVNIVVLCPNSL